MSISSFFLRLMFILLLRQIGVYSSFSFRLVSILLLCQIGVYSFSSDWCLFFLFIRLVSILLLCQIGVYSFSSDWCLFFCVRLVSILFHQIGFYSYSALDWVSILPLRRTCKLLFQNLDTDLVTDNYKLTQAHCNKFFLSNAFKMFHFAE